LLDRSDQVCAVQDIENIEVVTNRNQKIDADQSALLRLFYKSAGEIMRWRWSGGFPQILKAAAG